MEPGKRKGQSPLFFIEQGCSVLGSEDLFPVAVCSDPWHGRPVFLHNFCILEIGSTLLITCRSLPGNHTQRPLNLANQDPTFTFPFCVAWPMNLINTWKIPFTPLTPAKAGNLGCGMTGCPEHSWLLSRLGVRPTVIQVTHCSVLSDSLLES